MPRTRPATNLQLTPAHREALTTRSSLYRGQLSPGSNLVINRYLNLIKLGTAELVNHLGSGRLPASEMFNLAYGVMAPSDVTRFEPEMVGRRDSPPLAEHGGRVRRAGHYLGCVRGALAAGGRCPARPDGAILRAAGHARYARGGSVLEGFLPVTTPSLPASRSDLSAFCMAQ